MGICLSTYMMDDTHGFSHSNGKYAPHTPKKKQYFRCDEWPWISAGHRYKRKVESHAGLVALFLLWARLVFASHSLNKSFPHTCLSTSTINRTLSESVRYVHSACQ